jgi:hypothetical protein
MVNHSNQPSVVNILTWQSILWRLLLTALLLLMLAGSSLTIFSPITTRPDTRVLPTLTGGAGTAHQEPGIGQQSFPSP